MVTRRLSSNSWTNCWSGARKYGYHKGNLTKGELIARLRIAGFRFIAQSTLILRLDQKYKLKHVPQDELSPFTERISRTFRGPGHKDVSDDEHLYVAASTKKTVVVTQDENLLARASELEAHTKVKTLTPSEILEDWASES